MSADRRTRSERRREGRQRRRAGSRSRSIWRGPLPIVGSVVLIAAIVGGFVLLSRSQQPPSSGGDATAVVATLAAVDRATLDAVGAGGLTNPLQSSGAATALKGASGKPVVIYVGAEYCPFCASERWSLIVALSRFGTFRDLQLTRSSATDVYPNTPTFSFRGGAYASDTIEFSFVETEDRERKPLDSPTPVQSDSIARYDTAGSIPYVSIADRYYAVGSGYPPDVLAGKTWSDIADQLRDPTSPIAKAILGNANYLTAAICDVTAGAPAAVCSDDALRGLPRPK